jgi:hypothetical protein
MKLVQEYLTEEISDEKNYVCKECGMICKKLNALNKHISTHHNSKEYYDKWFKKENEGICKICGKLTQFISLHQGYKNCCSIECKHKYTYNRIKEETFKKHGVENIYQSKLIKDRIKNIHGNECSWKCEDVIEKIKKQNKDIQDKKRKTCKERYGTEYISQTNKFKEDRKKTWMDKYGVENPSQNQDISNKTFRTRILLKNYKDTDLTYQASYELDFLEKYQDKLDIENAPSIKYTFKRKNKVYHPDFYIPSLNLIVEIKNSWLIQRDKEEIEEKKQSALKNGYKYIIIINRDYTEFDKIINNYGLTSKI